MMTCTKEEIERKRQAALQKKQAKLISQNVSPLRSLNNVAASPYFSKSPNAGLMRGNTKSHEKFHPYSKTSQGAPPMDSPIPTKVVSGTVYLISEHRFEVEPSEFCTPLINIFKSISSRIYNCKTNLWNFSIDHYQELMEKAASLAPHVVLGSLPPYILKVLREPVPDPTQIDLSPIEATLREKLLSFQQEGVRFGISRRGRCLIADDMGLGKTFQALAIASYYRHDWPLLVVTTSSMRETWRSKINELLPSVPVTSIVTLTTRKDALLVADRQTEVVIASYKVTTIHTDLLKSKKFGVVIIDESHNLKSGKTLCSAALGGAARAAARVVLLSGTPALSRPAELYTQLQLVDRRLLPCYTEYGKRYCAGKQTAFGWDMSGRSHLAELGVLLQRRYLIRRTKDQVLALAEKTRETVMLDESLLDFSATERRELGELAASCRRAPPAQRRAALLTLFAQSARVRIPAVCKYVSEVLCAGSEKFLLFAHHRNVLAAVCDTLDRARTHYVAITGDTPAHLRPELVDRFQSQESCRAAVLSLTAAGAGLTLTAAALVVLAELGWTPAALAQAEARAHRLGQRAAVRVRYLLAPGTADDLMWPLLRDKLHVLNDVGLSEDSLEDTPMGYQESNNKILQYLSPLPKNTNDYIPGTNIRKHAEHTHRETHAEHTNTATHTAAPTHEETSTATDTISNIDLEDIMKCFLGDEEMLENGEHSKGDSKDDIDRSFIDDEEGDELLANIEL